MLVLYSDCNIQDISAIVCWNRQGQKSIMNFVIFLEGSRFQLKAWSNFSSDYYWQSGNCWLYIGVSGCLHLCRFDIINPGLAEPLRMDLINLELVTLIYDLLIASTISLNVSELIKYNSIV
jgi:hypothetical protein